MVERAVTTLQIKYGLNNTYRHISNKRRAWIGNQLVDHTDVVGASPVILDLTLGFHVLRKDNYKTRRETFEFWHLVPLILDILR